VLAQRAPTGSLQLAFEAGADDLVILPKHPEQLLCAIENVIARRGAATVVRPAPVAPLICVLGPKGGAGKTLVAANLAVPLARRGQRVVLVDLDLQFGDLALAMGVRPELTIYQLVEAGLPYSHHKLDRHLMRHPSGARVLVGPTRPEYASSITVERLRDIYASLRTMCDIVIVDTPPAFTPQVLTTIDASSAACMVAALDSLSLKNTKLGLETLDLVGYPPENISLVLNRADSRVGITPDEVYAIVGRAPDVEIPSDREIPRAVNEGNPIVLARKRSAAAKAFEKLADLHTSPLVEDIFAQLEADPALLARIAS
jgi:pilus assembly protein CpaE